jgi:hypothetical protein
VLVAADSVDARTEAAEKPTTQVNLSVGNDTQINLGGLSDADLEVLEAMQRKLTKDPSPPALTHVEGENQ